MMYQNGTDVVLQKLHVPKLISYVPKSSCTETVHPFVPKLSCTESDLTRTVVVLLNYYYYYYYYYIRLTAFFQDNLGKPAPER